MKQIDAQLLDELIDHARLHAIRIERTFEYQQEERSQESLTIQLEVLQRRIRKLGALHNLPPILYSQIKHTDLATS